MKEQFQNATMLVQCNHLAIGQLLDNLGSSVQNDVDWIGLFLYHLELVDRRSARTKQACRSVFITFISLSNESILYAAVFLAGM